MVDLVIIGAGPAGAAATVYAARKRLQTVLISPSFENQSLVSPDIQNWIGTRSISGENLAKSLEDHVRAYEGQGLEIKLQRVTNISKEGSTFIVETNKGEKIETRAVLIATGSDRRKLDVPGALEFDNKGVTYCATCDGPIFSGMDVVVVGGGNAGFESAAQLAAYTKSVTLIHRHPTFKADKLTEEAVSKLPNVTLLPNTEPVRVLGEQFVSGIEIRNKETGEVTTIPCNGIFVEIGSLPQTGFANEVVEMNETNHIKVDPRTQMTTTEGIWAAGDCTDGLYHQNNIAAGDAVKALENLYIWLQQQK